MSNNGFGPIKFVFLMMVAAFIGMSVFKPAKKIEPANDEWFQAEVVASDKPVLVKFGADWCGPCRFMDQSLDQVARRHPYDVKFIKINVDQNQELSSHYRVGGIPHTFIFYKGNVVADKVGALDAEGLENWISDSTQRLDKVQ